MRAEIKLLLQDNEVSKDEDNQQQQSNYFIDFAKLLGGGGSSSPSSDSSKTDGSSAKAIPMSPKMGRKSALIKVITKNFFLTL